MCDPPLNLVSVFSAEVQYISYWTSAEGTVVADTTLLSGEKLDYILRERCAQKKEPPRPLKKKRTDRCRDR